MINMLASLPFAPVAPGLPAWNIIALIAVICLIVSAIWQRTMADQARRIDRIKGQSGR